MSAHPSDAELRRFLRHEAPADGAIAVDDHLATCEACRRRAVTMSDAASRWFDISTDLLDVDAHLSEEQIQHYVRGDVAEAERTRLDRHLAECRMCAREVEDLRTWIAARSPARRRMYLAAAAAVALLLVTPLALSRWRGESPAENVTTLAGLDLLSPDQQARVEQALREGVVSIPASLLEIRAPTETLMGARPSGASFELEAPVRTVTPSDRPEFRWTALPGADDYTVAVFDSNLQLAAGPATVTTTRWIPPQALARERSYLWQVTARRGSESVVVPTPPAPQARFMVMEAAAASTLERIAVASPQSHLLRGILYAQAGARHEAETHLRQVPTAHLYADVARRTLVELQAR